MEMKHTQEEVLDAIAYLDAITDDTPAADIKSKITILYDYTGDLLAMTQQAIEDRNKAQATLFDYIKASTSNRKKRRDLKRKGFKEIGQNKIT